VDHWLECLRSCSTLFRRPRHKHRRRPFAWSALRIVLHPQLLSVEVRISRERGDFCRCLAVDFVRKTVYHRQASLCTWLESYTVTANSFYPALFACFLCLLAVHSHTLRCIRADLTAIFAVTRFSKLPVPPSCCSDSIAYARIGGRCAGQSAPVRPQLCNQLCNSRPTTAYNYDVLAHTSGEALSAPSSRIPRLV
jgi:hypothetical protein